MGNPEFAVTSLKALYDDGQDIAAVVTMPDRVGGRGRRPIIAPVKTFAVEHGIPVLQPEKLRDPEFLAHLKSLQADLFIVIAFRMLPREVWQMPPRGTFNLHASLLPRYRGAAPMQWALINGDTQTGVTTFMLQHQLDTGDIIDRQAITVGPDDNLGQVHDTLMTLGARLTLDTVHRIEEDCLTTTPQSAFEGTPTPAPKITKDTCHIQWQRPAQKVHNLVRGLSPTPGAWGRLQPEGAAPTEVKILATSILDDNHGLQPGQVSAADGHIYIGCGDRTAVEVLELQAAGHRRMTASDYLRGCRWTAATIE